MRERRHVRETRDARAGDPAGRRACAACGDRTKVRGVRLRYSVDGRWPRSVGEGALSSSECSCDFSLVGGHVGLSETPLGYGFQVDGRPPSRVGARSPRAVHLRSRGLGHLVCNWPAVSQLLKHRSYHEGYPACLSAYHGLACAPAETVGLSSA